MGLRAALDDDNPRGGSRSRTGRALHGQPPGVPATVRVLRRRGLVPFHGAAPLRPARNGLLGAVPAGRPARATGGPVRRPLQPHPGQGRGPRAGTGYRGGLRRRGGAAAPGGRRLPRRRHRPWDPQVLSIPFVVVYNLSNMQLNEAI
ncbi:MAG: hypothetical protein MZU95_14980, partial [Desulfomicrobium escambiense]|nr:hypothetical protein [Desulfomicrobium escambiense]